MAIETLAPLLAGNDSYGYGGDIERKARAKLAYELIKEGSSGAPVQHWTQGLARVAQALSGNIQLNQLEKESAAEEAQAAAVRANQPGLPGYIRAAPPMQSPSLGPRSRTAAALTNEEPSAGQPGQQFTDRPGGDTIFAGGRGSEAFQHFEPTTTPGGLPAYRTIASAGQPPQMPVLSNPTPAGAIPVQTQAITPPAPQVAQATIPQSPQAAPQPLQVERVGPQFAPGEAESIERQLRSRDKGNQAEGRRRYDAAVAKANQKPEYNFHPNPDGTITATNKTDPREVRIVDPKNAQSIIDFTARKEAAVDTAKEVAKREINNALPGTSETATHLRKEVQGLPSYKNIAQSAPVYKSMLEAASRDNRAADVNLIYGMAKLMDPGSVVRESEMTVAQAVATLPQSLQAQVKSQLQSTGRLDPDVRAAIMQEGLSRINAYHGMFKQDVDMYKGIVQRGRLNEADVIPNFGEFGEFKPTPKASTITPDQAAAELARRRAQR